MMVKLMRCSIKSANSQFCECRNRESRAEEQLQRTGGSVSAFVQYITARFARICTARRRFSSRELSFGARKLAECESTSSPTPARMKHTSQNMCPTFKLLDGPASNIVTRLRTKNRNLTWAFQGPVPRPSMMQSQNARNVPATHWLNKSPPLNLEREWLPSGKVPSAPE